MSYIYHKYTAGFLKLLQYFEYAHACWCQMTFLTKYFIHFKIIKYYKIVILRNIINFLIEKWKILKPFLLILLYFTFLSCFPTMISHLRLWITVASSICIQISMRRENIFFPHLNSSLMRQSQVIDYDDEDYDYPLLLKKDPNNKFK